MPLILPVNNVPVITTASLPSGSAGTAYGPVQMTASGGVPPYTWSIQGLPSGMTFTTAGVLAGTPSLTGSFTVTFQVSDSHGIPSFQLQFPLVVGSGQSGGSFAPARIFPAWVENNQLQFAWWSNPSGPADSYNVYRADVNGGTAPYVSGIVEAVYINNSYNSLWFTDWNQRVAGVSLLPNTTYTYWVTGVTGGIESSPSPSYTVTTRDASPGSIAPTAPTNPSTYITPAPTSYGGTIWTVTKNDTIAAGTAGTGTLGNVGCSFNWAGNNAQPGDTVVLTAGQSYTSSVSAQAFVWNVSGTAGNPINVISSEDPVFKAGGLLIPYAPYASGRMTYSSFTLSAPLSANATSATMTTNWPERSQFLPVVFYTTEVCSHETRMCQFTANSPTVTWISPLVGATTQNTILTHLNGVYANPSDTNAMPLMTFHNNGVSPSNGGVGLLLNGSFIRFVGINLSVAPSQPMPNQGFHTVMNNGNNNTFDRCVSGNDTMVSTWSSVLRFMWNDGQNTVVNQCFLYGFSGGNNTNNGAQKGGDSQCVYCHNNGPVCVQSSFLECSSESVFSGGSYVSEANTVHDVTVRGNYSQKNGAWSRTPFGEFPKNHVEFKIMHRAEVHDNIFMSNWFAFATGGQNGRAFNQGPIDQVAEANETRALQSITWNNGVATLQTNPNTGGGMSFDPTFPIGSKLTLTVQNVAPAGYNGTFIATIAAFGTNTVTFTYPLAVNPGPTTNLPSTLQTTVPPQASIKQVVMGTQPWNIVEDINIHDNLIYGCATAFYPHQDDGHQPGGYCRRFRFANNQCWINPTGTDDRPTHTLSLGEAFNISCHVTDVTIDHNTVIAIPKNTGFLATGTAQVTVAMQAFSISANGNQPVNHVEHLTITNNLLDGVNVLAVTPAGSGGLSNNGPTLQTIFFDSTTLTMSNNAFVLDNRVYAGFPSGTNANLGGVYTAVISGFAGNTVMPPTPQTWNINVAPYNTFSTTGGPIGAIF